MTAERRPDARDRILAWVVTGPLGRLAAFLADLGAAVAQGLINKLRRR